MIDNQGIGLAGGHGGAMDFPASWMYPNGLLENYVNPIGVASKRPYGSFFSGYTPGADTYVDPNPKDPRSGDTAHNVFPIEQWGVPWQSDDPQFRVHNEPALDLAGPSPPVLPSTQRMADPSTQNSGLTYPGSGGGVHPASIFDRLAGVGDRSWAFSPWATVFWGAGVIWLANEIFLKSRYVAREDQAVASAAASPGRATQKTGTKVVDTVTEGVGTVTEGLLKPLEEATS